MQEQAQSLTKAVAIFKLSAADAAALPMRPCFETTRYRSSERTTTLARSTREQPRTTGMEPSP